MKIHTTQFGEIDVAEESVMIFEKGIPGFEDFKEYALIPADASESTPFFFLQSTASAELSFFLVDPFVFFADYDVKIEESMAARLGLEDPSGAIVLTTITTGGDMKDATTNLKAPIILNNNKRLGMQIVLDNKSCGIKQPLFHSDAAGTRQV